MIVVNSVCGCAAGKARPGIAMALQHARRPDVGGTVFAGARHRSHRSRARVLRAVSALVAVGRAAAGRQAGVHAGAARHREPRRRGDRRDARRRRSTSTAEPSSRRTRSVGQLARWITSSCIGLRDPPDSDFDFRLAAPRVHLQVRIALQAIDRNERRAVARREPLFGAAIAAHFPRRANQLRELLVGGARRAAAAAGRCRARRRGRGTRGRRRSAGCDRTNGRTARWWTR